jgi:hypothetical protein
VDINEIVHYSKCFAPSFSSLTVNTYSNNISALSQHTWD